MAKWVASLEYDWWLGTKLTEIEVIGYYNLLSFLTFVNKFVFLIKAALFWIMYESMFEYIRLG